LSLARDAVRGGADSLAVRGVSGKLGLPVGTDEIYVASRDICSCVRNDKSSFGGCFGSLKEDVEGLSTRTVSRDCNCSSEDHGISVEIVPRSLVGTKESLGSFQAAALETGKPIICRCGRRIFQRRVWNDNIKRSGCEELLKGRHLERRCW
jgi:hypothetical protein